MVPLGGQRQVIDTNVVVVLVTSVMGVTLGVRVSVGVRLKTRVRDI